MSRPKRCNSPAIGDSTHVDPSVPSVPSVLILDLGGVFVHFSAIESAVIKPFELKHIMDSPEWHAFERGKLPQESLYDGLTKRFCLGEGDLAKTIELAAATLQRNDVLYTAVRALKDASGGKLRVIAMSNIAKESFETLHNAVDGWDLFDRIFLSSDVGLRKPDSAFYKHVCTAIDIEPCSAVFVDDRCENVIVAQALGMHGITFSDNQTVVQNLNSVFGDPIMRGRAWMDRNAKMMWSTASTGVEVRDQFSQIVMLHLTDNYSLVNLAQHDRYTGRWNVFAFGAPVLTSKAYPDDCDTSTMALLKLDIDQTVLHKTMNDMLELLNEDGLLQCYFDKTRPRLDPFISANVLRLFFAHGRGDELRGAVVFLEQMLRTRAYEHGTRYYHLPDWLFYYLGSLCHDNRDEPSLGTLRRLTTHHLTERIGCSQDAPSAALRLLACQDLGIPNVRDTRVLLEAQQADGNWSGWVWRYGRSSMLVSNDGLTTALAVRALQNARSMGKLNGSLV